MSLIRPLGKTDRIIQLKCFSCSNTVLMKRLRFPFTCNCREYVKLTCVTEYVHRSTLKTDLNTTNKRLDNIGSSN